MNSTLLYIIYKKMDEKKWNQSDLAKYTDIHISDISRIFNDKLPLSLKNLDAITESFRLARGSLYKHYIEECFNKNYHLDKRRSEQFLYRCATEGYTHELDTILNAILEEKVKAIRDKSLLCVFNVAEKVFQDGKNNQALPLYEFFTDNTPNRFSEQVAICYFRIFYMVRLTNKGRHALSNVLEHIAYMPEEFQILSYLWITATYYVHQQWTEVLKYAKKLESDCKEIDHYGRALIYQSLSMARLGAPLNDILEMTTRYAQLNDYYANIAVGNRFVIHLDLGFTQYVDSYLDWLKGRDDFYVGMPRVLEAYVKSGRIAEAKAFIEEYRHMIDEMATSKDPFKQHIYLYFRYTFAMYECTIGNFLDGLDEILDVAYIADNIGNNERFKKCLLLFWEFRKEADMELEEKYLRILRVQR
ncbi:helix-turn-helix domain-containing protein [Peribacillus muralis]|uniref:helix-turn-helix domain-containing protein n=1 Tax=Peribacillus muralis TaxID=264697 RepID=UPI0036731FD1